METTQSPAPRDDTRCVSCAAALDGSRCEHCGVAQRAGRFVVERVIAQTPHSRVYRARDEGGRAVALKELHFASVPGSAEIDAFEREAATLQGLQHPAIPRFVASFQEGAGVGLRLYVASELVDGESLATRLQRGALTEDEARRVAREVLTVLQFLHSRTPAVLHRDVKPANIVFRADGRVVLVDFGSARRLDGSRTHRSTLVGTFGYMPPEQLGGTVDRSSDLYALAATLLHAVTGQPPSELLDASLRVRVPGTVSPSLAKWFSKGLSLEPKRRFRSASHALAELDAPVGEPPIRPLFLAGVLVALAAAGVGLKLLAGAGGGEHALPGHPPPTSDGAEWFARARVSCNHLQVGRLMATAPPPAGPDGAGYGAGCYALATRYADARRLIETLAPAQRAHAAWRVFEIAHPVADEGDDTAAGPMMELVLEYWPENFQALYHAGIAEYASGETEQARRRLEAFLRAYTQDDNFTRTAKVVLERIRQGLPMDPNMARPD